MRIAPKSQPKPIIKGITQGHMHTACRQSCKSLRKQESGIATPTRWIGRTKHLCCNLVLTLPVFKKDISETTATKVKDIIQERIIQPVPINANREEAITVGKQPRKANR